MIENIPFFISPPYQVPPISWMRSVRLKAMKFSEFRPCSFHCGLVHFAPFITMKSGSKSASSSSLGRMNMFLTKCACQATSVIKRTLRRVSALAPQKASTINSRLPDNCWVTSPFRCCQVPCESGLLSFLPLPLSDHQTVSRVVSSRTRYLSFGERPVKCPCRRR